MADQIYSEAFAGGLTDLPNIDKKEQVFVQWLDIVASEVFVFESTAVQYTAHFGNKSLESCYAWRTAQTYSSAIISHVQTQMIIDHLCW